MHTQFEYATWYYQYKIEYSLDGKTWKLYADRSKNTQHGSLMIDFGNVKARYLRTTILGTEYPGLNKAIWNIKVFDNAEYNPVMNTSIKKWESLKGFGSQGLLVDLNFDNLRIGSVAADVLNKGKLAGVFSANGTNKPLTSMIGGRKALVFSGTERLSSSVRAPSSMLGNSSYSVSMWVLNPEIDKQETIVLWTVRGGVDLSNAAVGYGNSKGAGAATHLGWADLGYRNLPKANEWHMITMVFDGTMERIYVDGKLDRAERRMLFVNNLTRFIIGGNEDGTSGFSGALASLKIYDFPLTDAEINKAYAKGLDNSTAVYVDAKNLEYGNLSNWVNNGAALGDLICKGSVEVADINGKIAVVLANGSKVLMGDRIIEKVDFSKPFSVVFSLFSVVGSKTDLFFGKGNKAIRVLGNGKWQQVICSLTQGKFQVFINGKPANDALVRNNQGDQRIFVESSVDVPGATIAISSISIYTYGLDHPGCLKEFNFWEQTLGTGNLKASFVLKPSAVTPNMVYMVADKPKLPGSVLEYLFKNDKNEEDAKWLRSSGYMDFSAFPQSSYNYTVKIRDNFGNVTQTSLPFAVRTDSSQFVIKKQRGSARSVPAVKDGLSGTSWDGLLGNADTVTQQSGILRMVSHNTFWDGSEATGPFAYQNVEGDFIAEVTLSDMLGLKEKKAYGANEAGIMVKASASGRMLLQNGIMPGWGVGNIVTDLGNGGRRQTNNLSGWNFYRHLQIQRAGHTFFMRGSSDGKAWVDLPGSPVKRDDLGSSGLQVGLYHATYGDTSGYTSFSGFKVIQKK